jgi:trehalose-phosphatase
MLLEGIPENFWEKLGTASRCVLMLDYDGTLAPFRVDRDNAFPYPGVKEVLERILEDTDTRLVLVTGRWTKDLLKLLPLHPTPEIFGSHGLERLYSNGQYDVFDLEEKAVAGLAEIDAMAIQAGLEDRIEGKPGCLALHWRGLEPPMVEKLRQLVQDDWQKVAAESGLSIFEFNGGMEVRAPERDKGDAVRTVLDEEPEGTAAIYLGDDSTDEDAFVAMEGRGLGILVAEESQRSSASGRLVPPEGMLAFLRRWAAVRGKKN